MRRCKWALARPGRAQTTIVPINTLATYLGANGCIAAPLNYYANANVAAEFRSRHTGGAYFALADGSVRFLSDTTDHHTYQYLGCRDDSQHGSPP